MTWKKFGGWVHEISQAAAVLKASVACSSTPGPYVHFRLGRQCLSVEAVEPQGLYASVDKGDIQHFPLRHDAVEGGAFAASLAQVRQWVSSVEHGKVVLLALVNVVDHEVLEALALLGCPKGPVRLDMGLSALAAAGTAGSSIPWDAAHASSDHASASVLIPVTEAV